MTADIDRTLADWFQSEALGTEPADGVALALEGARRRRPRPARLAGPGSHWGWAAPRVESRVPIRALVAVAVLMALVGGALVVGARLLVPPAPLPARLGLLAYAVEGDIFVADWDGANAVRIADGLPGAKLGCGSAGYWAEGPMWSPDGRFLTYRSPRPQVDCEGPAADRFKTILVSDPTGHVVAEVPGVGWQIPWSPDSTRFATWLDWYPSTRIGVYGVDGVRQAVLSLPPSLYGTVNGDYDPVWSPDGESLLFRTGEPVNPARLLTVEVPIDGSPPRPVAANDPRSHWLHAPSPDGTRVAYFDESRGELVVAEADGSEPRDLFSGYASYGDNRPVWSPTGDRVAIVAVAERVVGDDTVLEEPIAIHVVDVASGSVTVLATAALDEGLVLQVAEFSPEGDRILYRKGEPSLWSVHADGSDPQILVSAVGWGSGDWQSLMDASSPPAPTSP